MPWSKVVAEFCWMISGRNNMKWLEDRGAANIWQPWALSDGTIGRGYGYQFAAGGRAKDKCYGNGTWPPGKHLVADALAELRRDPGSRRACWSLWVADDLDAMALPPCHGCFTQLRIVGGRLHLHMHQRSADWCVGVPFNIAFYALLLKVCAQLLGCPEGGLHMSFGDAHIYEAHIEGARKHIEQFDAAEASYTLPLSPRVEWTPEGSGDEEVLRGLDVGQFRLIGYQALPGIKFEVAV
jgi:thymidylate synthase